MKPGDLVIDKYDYSNSYIGIILDEMHFQDSLSNSTFSHYKILIDNQVVIWDVPYCKNFLRVIRPMEHHETR